MKILAYEKTQITATLEQAEFDAINSKIRNNARIGDVPLYAYLKASAEKL